MRQNVNKRSVLNKNCNQNIDLNLIRVFAQTTTHASFEEEKLYLFITANSYIVKKILEKMTMNAEIDVQDKKERTPLHCAVSNNNADIVELLVDR